MYPEILHWGILHIRSYGLLLAIAFLVGTWVSLREARRLSLHEDKLVAVILAALVMTIMVLRVRSTVDADIADLDRLKG